MAQFLQTQGMSKKPTSYLDVMQQNKPNLFDFSDVKPTQPTQTKQMNFGQPINQRNVTNFSDYQSSLPKQTIQQPTTQKSSGFSIIPTANAMEEQDLLQQYLQDPKQDNNSKQELFKALQEGENPDNLINYLQTSGYKGTQPQTAEQGFFESIKYKPYTQEELTAYDPNKSTTQNILEGQGRYAQNIAGGLYNIVPGIAELGTNLVSGTAKDIQMNVGNMFGLISDEDKKAYNKALTEKTGQIAGGVIKDYTTKYGSQEGFNKAIMEDPTAIIGDVLSVIGVGIAGKSKLTNIQKGALETQKANIINQVKNATTLEQKSALIKQGIEASKQIAEKTKQVKSLQEAQNIVNKYNPYIQAPLLTVKGVQKTGEVLTKGGKVLSKGVEKGKTLIQPTIRATEDISANILQPYKGMTENLADANKGLQRVIQETGTKVDDFEVLAKNTATTKEKYGKILDESLNNVSGEKFSESADTALAQLGDLYKGTQSKASNEVLKRINKLGIKNQQTGLTAKEMQEVKVLHTKANNLFNEKGQTTGGFLADDLRNVRNELKTEIEDFASSQGITNIADINKVYGELLDTESLLKNQIANIKAFKGRALPTTTWEKIGSLIGKIPVIKGGVQGIFKEAGLSLKAGKIDPLEIQKRLPKLLEELKKAGVKEGQLKNIETQIRTFITPPPKPRLLLPPGKALLKPNQPTNVSNKKILKKAK